MNKITSSILLLWILTVSGSYGQISATATGGQVKQMPPSIMIIPKVKENEDIRTIMDQNPSLRIAVTKMGEYFQDHNYVKKDFEATLQAALSNKVFTSENQNDVQADLIRFGNPDIYVVLDVIQLGCNDGKIATVNMRAFYTATGLSLGDVTANGPCSRANFSSIIQRAITDNAERFLAMINNNLMILEHDGVPVYVEIGFSENSNLTMSSPTGPNKDELSDVIDKWFEQNTFKNQYAIQGTTPKLMMISDARIPMRNQATGANYSPKKFAKEISDFLKSMGLSVTKHDKGASLYFTIN